MKDLDILQPDLAKRIIDTTEDGNALEFEGAYDEALTAYKKAWDMLPEPKTDWMMLSNWLAGCFCGVYLIRQELQHSLKWAHIQLQTRESDIDINPWVDLGKVYYELQDYEAALKYFKLAFDFGKARVFKEEPKKYYEFFKQHR